MLGDDPISGAAHLVAHPVRMGGMVTLPPGKRADAPCLEDGHATGGANEGLCGGEVGDPVAEVVVGRRDEQQVDRLGDLEPVASDADGRRLVMSRSAAARRRSSSVDALASSA